MKKFNIDFVGNLKKYLIVSLSLIVAGIIAFAVMGVEVDINFKGGSRFTYTYEGDIDTDKVAKVASDFLNEKATVTQSTSALDAGSSKVVISVAGVVDAEALKTDDKDADKEAGVHEKLEKALQDKFSKNKIAFAESNVIQSTIAKGFYTKSIVALALAAVLVVIYVGIRFRKIGGFSAALFAWVALIHDVIIAFMACVVFRLSIDTNFIAVILTILGYSLNDTIIIYDRIRENRRKAGTGNFTEVVNLSINQTLTRTIVTSITTFIAVVVVALVAEAFGVTALRSFAIPMAIGMVSGSYSSICLSGPLWVRWIEFRRAAKEKKEANYAGKKKRK